MMQPRPAAPLNICSKPCRSKCASLFQEKTMSDQRPLPLYEILEAEYVRLHGALPADYYLKDKTPEDRLKAIYALIHALPDKERRAALCISGGGIRSATFALGILQGLARCGLLD